MNAALACRILDALLTLYGRLLRSLQRRLKRAVMVLLAWREMDIAALSPVVLAVEGAARCER